MRAAGPALTFLLAFAAACASSEPSADRAPPTILLPTIVPEPAPPREPSPPPPEWIAGSRVPEFAKCAACHNAEQSRPHGLGPNLFGAFGARAGSKPGYLYSPALRQTGLVWDSATLDRFLENPRSLVPGTKMTFAGLRNPEERKAVIAFLKLRSNAPR